jgi:hypothetical protein
LPHFGNLGVHVKAEKLQPWRDMLGIKTLWAKVMFVVRRDFS